MDGGVIVVTEQTNKKLMLDESPDMPLQFKWRKFGGAIFTATQTMEHVKEGRKLGPTPAGMLPQEVWLNRLIAMEETLPRGKFLTDSAAATKTSSMTWPPIISVLSDRKSDRGIDESPGIPTISHS